MRRFDTISLPRPEAPSDVATIASLTTDAILNAPHAGHIETFTVNALRRGADAPRAASLA